MAKAIVDKNGVATPTKKKKLVNKKPISKTKSLTKAVTIANGHPKDQKKQQKQPAHPKKRELEVGANDNDDDDEADEEKEAIKKPKSEKANDEDKPALSIKDIIPAVFGIFSNLQSGRLSQNNLNRLVNLLRNEPDDAKRLATCSYTLKRLVRATGSDDMQSVSQSAANIHCILTSVPNIDIYDLLETMKRDLPVSSGIGGKQKKGKTDSLASVGQVITVYTIMQTPYFKNAEPKLLTALYTILIGQLKGREYLASMSANILADSFTQLNASVFESHVWSQLKSVILLPIAKQKIYLFDLLLAAYFQKILSRNQLESALSLKNFEDVFELYLNSSISQNANAYKRFAKFLIQKEQAKLLKQWQKYVDDKIVTANNSRFKMCALQIITYVLLYCNESSDQRIIVELFSPNVLEMLFNELQSAKRKRSEKTKASHLELKAIFPQLEAILLLFYKSKVSQDDVKVQILMRLLDNAVRLESVIHLPKYIEQLINELSPDGVYKVYSYFRDLLFKESVSKSCRIYCLGRLNAILARDGLTDENRKTEMLQMLYMATFNVNYEQKPCSQANACEFNELKGTHFRAMFYNNLLKEARSLEDLLPQLNFFTSRVIKEFANSENETKLRCGPRSAEQKGTWKAIENIILEAKKQKNTDKLKQTLDGLILFVSLTQLSGDPRLVTVLKDLIQCKVFATSKEKSKKTLDVSWKEVLTDSLLVLNLQNEQFWRKFINLVLASVIEHLEEQHLEQILAVLDMRKNPLSKNENEDEDADDDEEEDDEEDESEASSDEDSSEDEDDENEKDDEETEKEENEVEEDDTENARLEELRESVRLALTKDMANNDDDDNDGASSVDWNDVDEAEGERLNAALERSFQAFKPKTAKSEAKRRPTKSERINSTTLMHFRIRALDMLEVFVSKKPEIEIILDIIQSVFQVYMSCSIGPHAKEQQLREASIKLMRKIINQTITYKPEQDKSIILEVIEQLMATASTKIENDDQKKPQQQHQPKAEIEVMQWRDKFLAHLVSQFTSSKNATKIPVWPLLEGYIVEWISRRKTSLTLASFEAIFNTNWPGVAHVANAMSSHLLSDATRSQRRYQILKLLSDHSNRFNLIYKNYPKALDQLHQQIIEYTELALDKSDFQKSKEGKLLSKILAQGTDPKCRELIEKIAK
ncbi:uncharacterized protein Dwil_GK16442 [Drosophila willistoni]|uniref:Uncharacterized protein n=1 Tax=Drosophila willistoni TaxID=7260 RepID=B4N270_DROWI|nr:myb-binding protein 1A [Drosophila willistoni]EDW78459.1 uncharacterized protein Dwil_GK16442 [Drosophila willistoni]